MVASAVHEAEAMQLDVVVREYDPERDRLAVEDMERRCEVSYSADGKMALFTDLLGDPFSRVRLCPCSLMLVAEVVVRGGGAGRIVGVVRGCVKVVNCGSKLARCSKSGAGVVPLYTKLAYLLGLRVSPTHRLVSPVRPPRPRPVYVSVNAPNTVHPYIHLVYLMTVLF